MWGDLAFFNFWQQSFLSSLLWQHAGGSLLWCIGMSRSRPFLAASEQWVVQFPWKIVISSWCNVIVVFFVPSTKRLLQVPLHILIASCLTNASCICKIYLSTIAKYVCECGKVTLRGIAFSMGNCLLCIGHLLPVGGWSAPCTLTQLSEYSIWWWIQIFLWGNELSPTAAALLVWMDVRMWLDPSPVW